MREVKKREIANAIYQLMLENKINNDITNSLSGQLNDKQGQSYFLYLEISNTWPQISYVFNTHRPLTIGRDMHQSVICIQDNSISKCHGCLFEQQGYAYIQNVSKTQGIQIKRGLKKFWVPRDQSSYLKHSDRIYIGNAVLKVYLFRGNQWIVN